MHKLRLVMSTFPPYHAVKAICSCTAGSSGMCSHIVGLLNQLIHCVMMRLTHVPVDLTCTQMQQSWHKPCSSEIEPTPVMNIVFYEAKQSTTEAKKDPVHCSLFELMLNQCKSIAMNSRKVNNMAWRKIIPPVYMPKYYRIFLLKSWSVRHLIAYLKVAFYITTRKRTNDHRRVKPLFSCFANWCFRKHALCFSHWRRGIACSTIKITLTLDEAHSLELNTRQQSLSANWQQSSIGG